MKKSFVSALLVSATLLASTQAHALSTVATTARLTVETIALSVLSSASSQASSISSSDDYKIIIAAQDDAANMVASNGQIRGQALLQAFEVIRAKNPALEASDMQLAEVVLKIGSMK
ncbi:MAG: DUF2388 domain-containing protein [Bdellovibrio sp.]|nr:DUF2388 domain-containing protein [Bdellovibrio sp.]